MAEQVKALKAKPAVLSLILRTHKVKGEPTPTGWFLTSTCTTHTHTCIFNVKLKKKSFG